MPGVHWKVARGIKGHGDKVALGGMGAPGTSELREWWVVVFFFLYVAQCARGGSETTLKSHFSPSSVCGFRESDSGHQAPRQLFVATEASHGPRGWVFKGLDKLLVTNRCW